MTDHDRLPKTTWLSKFACAFRGLFWAVKTQSSFWIHVPVAIAVLVLAAFLKLATWQWIALIAMIGIVMAAELLNTAIEQIVKVVHPKRDSRIGNALDASAAGVLVVAVAAAIVGLMILLPPIYGLVTR